MRFAALAALVACAHPAPITRHVHTQVTLEPTRCELPALPGPASIVGYPDATTTVVMLSRTDVSAVLEELAALRFWAEAVAQCVAPP